MIKWLEKFKKQTVRQEPVALETIAIMLEPDPTGVLYLVDRQPNEGRYMVRKVTGLDPKYQCVWQDSKWETLAYYDTFQEAEFIKNKLQQEFKEQEKL